MVAIQLNFFGDVCPKRAIVRPLETGGVAMMNILGFFRPGMGELLIILLIVLVVFGASRLPKISQSLGEAIKSFRKSLKEEENKTPES